MTRDAIPEECRELLFAPKSIQIKNKTVDYDYFLDEFSVANSELKTHIGNTIVKNESTYTYKIGGNDGRQYTLQQKGTNEDVLVPTESLPEYGNLHFDHDVETTVYFVLEPQKNKDFELYELKEEYYGLYKSNDVTYIFNVGIENPFLAYAEPAWIDDRIDKTGEEEEGDTTLVLWEDDKQKLFETYYKPFLQEGRAFGASDRVKTSWENLNTTLGDLKPKIRALFFWKDFDQNYNKEEGAGKIFLNMLYNFAFQEEKNEKDEKVVDNDDSDNVGGDETPPVFKPYIKKERETEILTKLNALMEKWNTYGQPADFWPWFRLALFYVKNATLKQKIINDEINSQKITSMNVRRSFTSWFWTFMDFSATVQPSSSQFKWNEEEDGNIDQDNVVVILMNNYRPNDVAGNDDTGNDGLKTFYRKVEEIPEAGSPPAGRRADRPFPPSQGRDGSDTTGRTLPYEPDKVFSTEPEVSSKTEDVANQLASLFDYSSDADSNHRQEEILRVAEMLVKDQDTDVQFDIIKNNYKENFEIGHQTALDVLSDLAAWIDGGKDIHHLRDAYTYLRGAYNVENPNEIPEKDRHFSFSELPEKSNIHFVFDFSEPNPDDFSDVFGQSTENGSGGADLSKRTTVTTKPIPKPETSNEHSPLPDNLMKLPDDSALTPNTEEILKTKLKNLLMIKKRTDYGASGEELKTLTKNKNKDLDKPTLVDIFINKWTEASPEDKTKMLNSMTLPFKRVMCDWKGIEVNEKPKSGFGTRLTKALVSHFSNELV